MFIASHVCPFSGIIEYKKRNDENEENNSTLTWDSSSPVAYKVFVGQLTRGEFNQYQLKLMVFRNNSMTEDETVRLACVDISRNIDDRYIIGTVSSLNDPPIHSFEARIYSSCALREIDNHIVYAREHLPPIDIYRDENEQDNPTNEG